MRFARISISPKFAITTCLSAMLMAGGVGCDSIGNFSNGFLNPAEVGRYKKEPLMMPIVNSLDTGVEEPNDQFASAQEVKPEDLVANNQDYVIGKNDLLSVSITDLVAPGVETVKTARVSESGNISLPLIGQIRAEGLTENQLEEEIRKAYRDQNLMPNAQVSVSVQQALARTFSILGSVSRPGLYGINQADFRILDALVTAGDMNSQGVDYLYVIRREDLAGGPTTMPAGGTKPAAPAAAPAGQPADPLAPRSQGNEYDYKKVALLMQDPAAGGAAAPAPATPPAANQPAGAAPATSDEGKFIIVDGKRMMVGNQPATAGTPGAPAGPAEAGPATAAPGMPAAPAASQPFEFNGPAAMGTTRIIRVPVSQLKNGDLRYNIVVRPQDMIIAPPPITGEYYMDGHVNRSGVYSLTARNITLKQAVAAAGGFDQLAIPSTHTEIIRRIGNDHEVYAAVDLDKVFAGTQPDIYLKPNDVVRVGTNAFAPFIAAFRNAFRITYGFGFLYDRNYAPQDNNNN